MWKILVVDDVETNRQLLIEVLGDKAKCGQASDGSQAFEIYDTGIDSEKYDLILLDVDMPEVNGIEFLQKLRAKEESEGIPLGDGIPVIMVTAHKESFIDAFNQGCDDYILKPIDGDKLLTKITEKLGS